MTVAAILLAGGESSRMGTAKPLLEWGGNTLIEYQLAQLKEPPVERVVVVLGHRADEVL
ncbi:MAG: NTP transferase domain-containing protein, partial [Dehalococcoidia bacterium]